jgi:hypothetical protein
MTGAPVVMGSVATETRYSTINGCHRALRALVASKNGMDDTSNLSTPAQNLKDFSPSNKRPRVTKKIKFQFEKVILKDNEMTAFAHLSSLIYCPDHLCLLPADLYDGLQPREGNREEGADIPSHEEQYETQRQRAEVCDLAAALHAADEEENEVLRDIIAEERVVVESLTISALESSAKLAAEKANTNPTLHSMLAEEEDIAESLGYELMHTSTQRQVVAAYTAFPEGESSSSSSGMMSSSSADGGLLKPKRGAGTKK